MYSIVCVSLSYDTRNVFSLFSVKYMGSCPLNRKKTMHGEIQVNRKPSVLVGFLCQKKDCAYTLWPSEPKYFPSLPNTLVIISLLVRCSPLFQYPSSNKEPRIPKNRLQGADDKLGQFLSQYI